ncbi:MAG: cyclase family protein [Promethearchaeota archaeon]
MDVFEIIEVSHTFFPIEDANRPFAIQKASLQDKTFHYDILKTYTHIGCYIEVSAHFYENGKTITDYLLDWFHGLNILLSVKEMVVDAKNCEKLIGNVIQEGYIVVI